MKGETTLDKLLSHMEPVLNEGKYVFTTVRHMEQIPRERAVCEVKEREGVTLVLPQKDADRLALPYGFVAAWITLQVHSALDAVGPTAAFSAALASKGISCNVLAGYCHGPIFVGWEAALHELGTSAYNKIASGFYNPFQ